jgi:TrmH family RNA methyltransferase
LLYNLALFGVWRSPVARFVRVEEVAGCETNNWRGTVEMIRRAGTRKGRATGGYFSIEGIRLHERALRAGVRVQQAIVTTSFQKDSSARVQTLLADLQEQGCRLEIVPVDVIGEIIGGRDLGQILGLVRMPEQRQLADVTNSKDMNRPLLLVAVDVKDPGNVGALLRTAHASGATAFVATGISDPFHPKALRTTMGSLFKLPVLLYKDPMPLINQLRELGIETVGTAVSGGTLLTRATFSNVGVAVLIGSEAWGLPENVQTGVDRLVSIPMKAGVDSFSVNAAAAIVLYEIGRIRE